MDVLVRETAHVLAFRLQAGRSSALRSPSAFQVPAHHRLTILYFHVTIALSILPLPASACLCLPLSARTPVLFHLLSQSRRAVSFSQSTSPSSCSQHSSTYYRPSYHAAAPLLAYRVVGASRSPAAIRKRGSSTVLASRLLYWRHSSTDEAGHIGQADDIDASGKPGHCKQTGLPLRQYGQAASAETASPAPPSPRACVAI